LELSREQQRVSGRKRDLRSDDAPRLGNVSSEIATCDIDINPRGRLRVLGFDHRRAGMDFEARNLAERYLRSRRCLYEHGAKRWQVVAQLSRISHVERVALE